MNSSGSKKEGKVLLINYAGHVLTGNTFVPDNSLAALAGSLLAHNIPVEIMDLQTPSFIGAITSGIDSECSERLIAEIKRGGDIEPKLFFQYRDQRNLQQRKVEDQVIEQVLRKVADEGITLIGFKLWAGNALAGSVRMAEAIRKAFPHLTIVAGGPAVRYAQEILFQRSTIFDFLIHGDGEGPIVELAQGKRENVSGTIQFKDGKAIDNGPAKTLDLNKMAFPVYDPSVYPEIDQLLRIRILDESRGCFNKCAFCSHPFFNESTRLKTPVRVVDEMEHANKHEGISYFRFSGSNPPWRFLNAIAKEILKRKLDIRYSSYASMNNIKLGDMATLASSGLRALFFGIESGDPAFLKQVHHKNNRDPEFIHAVTEEAMRAGIFVCVSIIVPSPFETEQTKKSTLDLLKGIFAHGRHGSVLVLPAFLAPGSEWWNRMSEFGFAFAEGMDRESYVNYMLDLDSEFLLPRYLMKDYGYTLNGKNLPQLLEESQEFIDELNRLGIPTNVDDASFMIADMGNMDFSAYKATILNGLLHGGEAPLRDLISRLNNGRTPIRLGA